MGEVDYSANITGERPRCEPVGGHGAPIHAAFPAGLLNSSQSPENKGNVRFWGRAEIKIDRSHGIGEYVEGFRCFLSMEGFSLEQINEAMSEACRVCRPSKVVAKSA